MEYKDLFLMAKSLNNIIKVNCGVDKTNESPIDSNDFLFDKIVTVEKLRKVTRKLFIDGHYAQAVEAAYKCVNNIVKTKTKDTTRDGADLMTYAFSEKNPIIKLNDLVTKSEQDEQKGFMQIFAGSMTGIRNPRAHEEDWADTEMNALYMISFANFLIQKINNLTED